MITEKSELSFYDSKEENVQLTVSSHLLLTVDPTSVPAADGARLTGRVSLRGPLSGLSTLPKEEVEVRGSVLGDSI